MQEVLSQIDPRTRYGEAIGVLATQLLDAPASRYSGPKNGMNPKVSYDCSGFVTYLRREVNDFCFLKTPENVRHCRDYAREGDLIHPGKEKIGDMVLYPDEEGKWDKHMGLVIEPGLQIHSPGGEGLVVEAVPIIKRPVLYPQEDSIYLERPHMYRRFNFQLGSWYVWDVTLEQLKILAPIINRQRLIEGDERLVTKVLQTQSLSEQLVNTLKTLKF